jgi:hypothetical protein
VPNECGVVRRVRHDLAVQLVLGGPGDGDPECERTSLVQLSDREEGHARPLKPPFLLVLVLVDGQDPSGLCRALAHLLVLVLIHLLRRLVRREPAATINKVFQLAAAKLRALDAQDERDGVHEVRLARAIGTDDRRKVAEGPNDLVTTIRFEVGDFDADEPHRAERDTGVTRLESGRASRVAVM